MAKITKSLSSKVNKDTGKAEIMLRFIYGNGKAVRAKSGLYIDPIKWSTNTKGLKTANFGKEDGVFREKLDNLCNGIIDAYTSIDKETISKEWLETTIDKIHFPNKYIIKEVEHIQTLIGAFIEFLDKHKLSDVRRKNYRVIGRAFQRFELYRKHTYTLDDITPDTLREFEKFLRNEHTLYTERPSIYKTFPESRPPKQRGQNTINEIFTRFRTFILWCNNADKTTNNPFKKGGYQVAECTYGRPIYIDIKERNIIADFDFSHRPNLAIQRDIFIFQCFVGCRVGDLYKMTTRNIIGGVLSYIPRKTKDGRPVVVEVPLGETAIGIIDRYRDTKRATLFPYISEQKYNDAIKEIFKLSGIVRDVVVLNPTTGESEIKPIYEMASSHLARRAFIGNLYKQVKDPNLVSSVSGHKEGSKAFSRYRDIDMDTKIELVALLEKGEVK